MRAFWGTLVWISASGMVFLVLAHVLWHAGSVIPGADLVLGNTLGPLWIIVVFSIIWGKKTPGWPHAACPWWAKLVAYITPWYMAIVFVSVILRLLPTDVKNMGFVSAITFPFYAFAFVIFSAKLGSLRRNQPHAQ